MKIGLALSGGGVLGVAHIGVLRVISRNNIKLDYIAGTSSGAMVGALFVQGGTELIEKFLDDLDAQGLFNLRKFLLKPDPNKIFNSVADTLRKYLPEKFEDLRTGFCCVATDFSKGEPVILDSGDLISAILASSAYPGVFAAQEVHGKSFIDGGISLNLPASVLQDKGLDFIIGSSLYNVSEMEKYGQEGVSPNRIVSAKRALDIMQKTLASVEVKKCDYCFTPPVGTFNWYNFDRINELHEIGDDYAKRHCDEFLSVLKSKLEGDIEINYNKTDGGTVEKVNT